MNRTYVSGMSFASIFTSPHTLHIANRTLDKKFRRHKLSWGINEMRKIQNKNEIVPSTVCVRRFRHRPIWGHKTLGQRLKSIHMRMRSDRGR